MRAWGVGLVAVLVAVGAASDGAAAVMCKKKSGAVVVRDDACRKKETAVVLSEFGALGPQGEPGEAGQQGEPGPRGPSHGYVTSFDGDVEIPQDASLPLMTLEVPAGSYLVTARLQAITVFDADDPPPTGNSYRFDCVLSGGETIMDAHVARVGQYPDEEEYLTYSGGFTGEGPIVFRCYAANNHPLTAQSGVMTAVRVETLEDQTPPN